MQCHVYAHIQGLSKLEKLEGLLSFPIRTRQHSDDFKPFSSNHTARISDPSPPGIFSSPTREGPRPQALWPVGQVSAQLTARVIIVIVICV